MADEVVKSDASCKEITETVVIETREGKDESTPKAPDKSEIDEELDDLLDSALKDFKKPEDAASSNTGSSTGTKKVELPSSDGSTDPMSDMFAEEFADQMAKQFEDSMKDFMGTTGDPSLMKQIEMLAASAGNAGDSPEAQQEFASTLSQTLSSLAQNSEGLEDEMSEEELMKAFTSMGMEEGQDGFMPMMQGMMTSLMSKEVLYPSLKEMSQKYPKWLEDNKNTADKKVYDRCKEQHQVILNICQEFEKETDTESEESKKLRFEKVVDLMQKMQELGNPPKEIVGDMAPGLEFDEEGMPKFPGLPGGNQCSVM